VRANPNDAMEQERAHDNRPPDAPRRSWKRAHTLLAALIVALLAAWIGLRVVRAREHEAWLRRTVQTRTGLRWPEEVSEVHLIYGLAPRRQAWISGHVRLPRDTVEALLLRHDFASSARADLAFVFGRERLPARYDAVAHPGAFHRAEGRAPDGAPYTMGLDAESGSLWFCVILPR
jgi:hypothetical protein